MSTISDKMTKTSLFVTRKQNKLSKPSLLIEQSKDLVIENSSDRLDTSMDFANCLMKNINNIRKMIVNRSDPYDIFEKIVDELSGNYMKCCEIIKKCDENILTRCNDLNDQVVSLENDMMNKINNVQQQSDNDIYSIDLTQKCKDEVNILWITFTDQAEINALRMKNKSDLIQEAKKIFSRMNIKLNKPHKTIIDVLIQKVSVKTDNSYENELILGIKFTNSIAVNYMKRQITDFRKKEFINENFDLIRYSVRNFWSYKIWKLLRVCYDLKNAKLIENVNVNSQGVTVSYNKSTNQQNDFRQLAQKKLIRNENDLNILRSEINDVCKEVSTFQIYNGEYFKLNFYERKAFKDNLILLCSKNCNAETFSPVSKSSYSNLINCPTSSSKII
ncbi:unnamed protein product [Chironomus riparius]|uniref:Uncharacterized protein n=1 Tax=Chironomus riparius TaxID=315576 RepID=A0A9N9RJI5_9DIPT|nr:unnamed protein product [Chironomus riparius]